MVGHSKSFIIYDLVHNILSRLRHKRIAVIRAMRVITSCYPGQYPNSPSMITSTPTIRM